MARSKKPKTDSEEAPKKGPGRNTKLTPETQQLICDSIRSGRTTVSTCAVADISEFTFYEWEARGESEPGSIYAAFAEATKKARIARRNALEDSIVDAGESDWKARAWILERTEPKRYAPRVRVHIDQELEDVLNRIQKTLPPEIYERVLIAATEGQDGSTSTGDSDGESGADDSDGEGLLPSSS